MFLFSNLYISLRSFKVFLFLVYILFIAILHWESNQLSLMAQWITVVMQNGCCKFDSRLPIHNIKLAADIQGGVKDLGL